MKLMQHLINVMCPLGTWAQVFLKKYDIYAAYACAQSKHIQSSLYVRRHFASLLSKDCNAETVIRLAIIFVDWPEYLLDEFRLQPIRNRDIVI